MSVTALLRKIGHPGRLLLSQATPPDRDLEMCFAFCTQKARWSGCRGRFSRDSKNPTPCDRFHLDLSNPPSWLDNPKVWSEIATWLKTPATAKVMQPTAEFLALPGMKSLLR
jgi:hypothetical protein